MSFEPELIGRAGATMEDGGCVLLVLPFAPPRPLAQGSFVLATGVRPGGAGGACRICGTT